MGVGCSFKVLRKRRAWMGPASALHLFLTLRTPPVCDAEYVANLEKQ